jgi:hypothetical protein
MRGAPPDPRDDVHALGVIWYQMLVGDFSEGAPTGLDWADELRHQGVDDRLVRLLGACVATKAQNRPPDALAVAERIESVLAPSATATTVVSSLNPAAVGQPVTFTATVKAVPPATGLPPGTMIFKNGPIDLGTVPLRGGTATLTTSALGAGTHGITARYGRNGPFLESTSPPLTQTINSARPKPDPNLGRSECERDMKEALEEWRTKGSPAPISSGTWQSELAPGRWLHNKGIRQHSGSWPVASKQG